MTGGCRFAVVAAGGRLLTLMDCRRTAGAERAWIALSEIIPDAPEGFFPAPLSGHAKTTNESAPPETTPATPSFQWKEERDEFLEAIRVVPSAGLGLVAAASARTIAPVARQCSSRTHFESPPIQ